MKTDYETQFTRQLALSSFFLNVSILVGNVETSHMKGANDVIDFFKCERGFFGSA